MRSRYWVTSPRDVTRPSFIAVCISGIVASTTLNDRGSFRVSGLGVRVCPDKAVAPDKRRTTENASLIVGRFYRNQGLIPQSLITSCGKSTFVILSEAK